MLMLLMLLLPGGKEFENICFENDWKWTSTSSITAPRLSLINQRCKKNKVAWISAYGNLRSDQK
jgi:hypothetical protein